MRCPETASSRHAGGFIFALLVLLLFIDFGSSSAHLALIRQHPLESAGVPGVGDRYGSAMCAGDFNGDGFEDLCVGAPFEDLGAQNGEWEGAVTISPGSVFGLTHVGAVQFGLLPTGDPFVEFGKAIASGNFNGDAYDDLAVGAPFVDVLGNADAGAVYVFMGSATGIDPNVYVEWTQEDLSGVSQVGDFFGWSLTTGDFDDNGADDLAIGGIGENNESGVVYVVYGQPGAGLSNANSDIFVQSTLGDADGAGDWFGYSLAAGPMDNDPQTDDLAIGAPYDMQSGPSKTGRVYVVRGLVNLGLTAGGSQNWNASDLGFQSQHLEGFGWSLAVGQFWAVESAFQQLAVGVPYYDKNGMMDAGRVIVLRPGMADPPVELFQDTPDDAATVSEDELFGWAVASAHLSPGITDDLLVGAPHEKGFFMGIPVDNGMVTRFVTSILDPFPVESESFSMDAVYLFDQDDRNLEMGYAFCVGQFDMFDMDNVVIGSPEAAYLTWVKPSPVPAPEEAAVAGQVHVYAPHRQVFNTRARSATAHDCNDNVVFSVRMFDPLQIASTTKAMTAWIASDHILWGLKDSTSNYTFDEPYIPNCVTGSEADLQLNETLTLADLLQLAVSESANDACYAIADLITDFTWGWPNNCGNLGKQVTAFIDTMNQRALDIGMPYTKFNNPAGRPKVNANNEYPYSTALGMARLGRESLKNVYFRRLVRRTDWALATNIENVPDGSNGWLKGMKGKVTGMDINGIKPGRNDPSKSTRLVSGRGDGHSNEVIATIFGVDGSGVADNMSALLCTLAVGLCQEPRPSGLNVIPQANFDPLVEVDSIPSSALPLPGKTKAIGELGTLEDTGKFTFNVYRQDIVTLFASSTLCINVGVEYTLEPGEMVTITATPFESQDGVRVFNGESTTANLLISHNQPLGTSFSVVLPPDEDSLVVGPTAMPSTDFSLSITNTSSTDTVEISIDELGYKYTLNLGDGVVAPGSFEGCVTHSGTVDWGNVVARVNGLDTTPGNTLRLIIRHPSIFTGIDDDETFDEMPPPLVGEVSAYPNPFNPKTTIAYETGSAAWVQLDIYDVMGRHIRRLENNRAKPAGAHRVTWDSANARGHTVASGVYFVRLRVGPEVRLSRVVLLK